MRAKATIPLLLVWACGPEPATRFAAPEGPADAGRHGEDAAPDAAPDAGPDAAPDAGPDAGPPCHTGERCDPIPIEAYPFVDERDTRDSTSTELDRYSCAEGTDESGPELFYRLEVPEAGLLEVRVDDLPGDAIDIDVHLLSAPTAVACLVRDDVGFSVPVEAGTYHLVADTWVNGAGEALAGPYRLTVDLTPHPPPGSCRVDPRDLEMRWASCGDSIDCFEREGARYLRTPATGPVVREAHLVTVADDFDGGWPNAFRDGIEPHHALSEAASGYAMERREPWAPAGEGGSEFGQGSTGRPLPVLDEAWYITMHWRHRPAGGTRMLVTNPANGRAVVAAAGHETGPGSNTAVAGVTEEIHHHLGTGHRSTLTVGFAFDEQLPLGPIYCAP